MAKNDSHLKVTADDLRATRVLTLVVKFFGSSRPIASSSIRYDLYPGLDTDSFNRQFLRDRELLATFGILVREAGQAEGDTLWQVDEDASYVQGDELSQSDAYLLYVLCHDMAFDQSFAYRDELRMALAKISRMYRGNTVPRTDTTTPTEHKLLSALVSCMNSHHAAAVTYTDAQGHTSQRNIAVLGTFGMRDNTYFVASRVSRDGSLVPDSIRTYRLDRFSKVREIPSCSYQTPPDFAVSDYERLPFQIGDALGTARFKVEGNETREAEMAMATHGTVVPSDDGSVWEVPYSDLQAVASWAIAVGLRPADGEGQLARACSSVVSKCADRQAYDQSLPLPGDGSSPKARKARAGRTGSISVARQLVALATSLTHEGDVITAEHIAQTLGVDFDYARHLIMLVSMGSGESIDYLPVILSDDDDEVSLMEGAAINARRVRLTRSETIALSTALSELGIPDDDPLVQALNRSYASPSFSADDVARTLEGAVSSEESKTMLSCSKAMLEGRGLSFSYHPVSGERPSCRRVVPHSIRHSDNSSYLEAFDLVRNDNRVFRIDRMEGIEAIELQGAVRTERPKGPQKNVSLCFEDRRYLDLFHWEGLEVIDSDDRGIVVRLPHYGGTWLARHLVACAGTVRIGDRALAEQVHEMASEMS